MSESGTHSITEMVLRVQAGDSQAAHELWQRSLERMIRDARRYLKGLPRRAVDEDDVANEVFEAFLNGVKENRFRKLEGRNDLWQILAMLAERKANSILRRELAKKRNEGKERGESAFEQIDPNGSARPGIGEIPEPHPQTTEQLSIVVRELLEKLDDDSQRRVALDTLAGYKNKEIAARLEISLRSVERKLGLIRDIWEEEFQLDDTGEFESKQE